MKGLSIPRGTALLAWLAALLLQLAPGRADAQVALDPLTPAPLASDGFALSRPDLLAPRQWALLTAADYANDPLVYRLTRPPRQRQVVVGHHLVLHLGAALSVHRRVMLIASLPIHTVMRGDDALLVPNTKPEGAGLGDLMLGVRIAIAGDARSRLALAGEVLVRTPTAELANRDQRYAGDQVGSYEGALVGELRAGIFAFRTRLGARFRKPVDQQNLSLGQQLLFGAGARAALTEALSLHVELVGSTFLGEAFDAKHTPLELLLGLKYQPSRLWLGAAAGPGLVDGYGSPDVRAIFTLGIGPHPHKEAPPAPVQQPLAQTAPRDGDADGIFDADDRCPDEAEDLDGREDQDGCPEHDRDGDGVADPDDRCPDQAEDRSGTADEDGCPERDADGDGVEDESDHCPAQPGSTEDAGCPRAQIGEPAFEVQFGHVEYGTGRDTPLAASRPTLAAARSILATNAQIARVRVEGHADDTGDSAYNQLLAERRARRAAQWLIQRGIAPARIEAYGCGQRFPVDPAAKPEARQRNRRVEFHVIAPASSSDPPHEGCTEVSLAP